VKKGQNYQIGTDIFFNIVEVQYSTAPASGPSSQESAAHKDFMMYLAKEQATDTKIYGIEEFAEYVKLFKR
jgi:hypothetical protein